LNADTANLAQASAARAAGLVARVYGGGIVGGLDDEGSWNAARDVHANLLATDKVSFVADPWAATHDARGFPFAFLGQPAGAPIEDVPAVTVNVDSGDLYGNADDFFFAPAEDAVGPTTWTTGVSVASSHTDPLGKACLMARASDAPGAAYVAVCRTADRTPLRVQWRDAEGGPTIARDAEGDHPSFFVRLDVTPRPSGSEAAVYGSRDGVAWTLLHAVTIAARLPRQGIAASSHRAGPMRFVFGALRRDARRLTASDLRPQRVGDCSVGTVTDAPF
jgi:hypothetical protein